MTEQTLGTITVTQVGIVVQDIEAKAQAWAEVLGLPVPEIMLTDAYEHAQTEYEGKPSTARARLAFFHLGQVDLELIEPVGEPSTWKISLTNTATVCTTSPLRSRACRKKWPICRSKGFPWYSAANTLAAVTPTSTETRSWGRSWSFWRMIDQPHEGLYRRGMKIIER